MQLTPSRLHDGICDCCDGADEEPSVCPVDTCEAIRAARAAARATLQLDYTRGAPQRVQAVALFAEVQERNRAEIQTLTTDTLPALREQQLPVLETAWREQKHAYCAYRKEKLGASSATALHGELWQGIDTATELVSFITAACQVAGELKGAKSKDNDTTCLPLRWAGLDAGIAWNGAGQLVENDTDVEDLTYYNSVSKDKVYKVADMRDGGGMKPSKKKRRLLYVAAEEDYFDDEEYDDFPPTDDYVDHDLGDDEEEKEDGPKRDEVVDAIRGTPFSASRVSFLDQADIVLAAIKKLDEEEEKEGDGDDSNEEGETKEEGKVEETPAVDPALIAPVRKELEKRKAAIERGLNYAASAKVLLESIVDTDILRALATGVVYHGNLSSLQVYQAIVSTVNGFSIPTFEACVAEPSVLWCPVQSVTRGGATIPSSILSEAMETFCKEKADAQAEPSTCMDTNSSDGEPSSIPLTMPDGYYGYFQVADRVSTDPLHAYLEKFFRADPQETSLNSQAVEADEKLHAVLDELSSVETKVTELKDEIGADDGPEKFGRDGELYSIKDKCFTVEAGKYIYEICLFGKAAQKDSDKPKGSGTSLGEWTGHSVETKTDREGRSYEQRVWKWEKGAKCWNGPQRSATAYVTCGAETQVLSADEPDTCRYVLQVASPLACDEDYRILHSLDGGDA